MAPLVFGPIGIAVASFIGMSQGGAVLSRCTVRKCILYRSPAMRMVARSQPRLYDNDIFRNNLPFQLMLGYPFWSWYLTGFTINL